MKIVAVDVPVFCAADLVPVHIVVEGTGFVRIGKRRLFVWKKLDQYVEVERGTVIAGKRVSPNRIPTAPTAPNANVKKPSAHLSVPEARIGSIVVDLGGT